MPSPVSVENATLLGRSLIQKATRTRHGSNHLRLICADITLIARQNGRVQSTKAEMVLVPQRERFGMCGAVPSQLHVAARSDVGTLQRLDFLAANEEDITTNANSIYTMLTSHAAPLPSCPGPLRFACNLVL